MLGGLHFGVTICLLVLESLIYRVPIAEMFALRMNASVGFRVELTVSNGLPIGLINFEAIDYVFDKESFIKLIK